MRIGTVIPAHNEASVIACSVHRARETAPASPIFVVADRCNDNTAAQATAAGAQVYERTDSPSGKGAALSWFLQVAADQLGSWEALVLLDADTVVDRGFFKEIERCLAGEAQVVQGFVQPTGGEDSPASTLAGYSEILSQAIGDAIRARLGWSVPLRGTGMALKTSILRELLPSVRTRVEDMEMSLLLAKRGTRVVFAPRAVVYDSKPAHAGGVAKQRARWLQGQAEVWHFYWRDILKLAFTGGPPMWSLLGALLLKPKALVFALKLALSLLVWLTTFSPPWLDASLKVAAALMLGLDLAYYAIGLRFVVERRRYARALLMSPFYLLMWLWSAALALVSRETWLRARDSS